MTKTLCTLRPAFWPNLEYFWRMYQCQTVILTDHLLFVKQSEMTVSAPFREEKQRLRIPVKHTGRPQTIAEKEMDGQHAWRREHIDAIKRIFVNSSWHFLYLDQIKNLYDRAGKNLTDLLYQLIAFQANALHLKTPLVTSARLRPAGDATQFILEACAQWGCNGYRAERQVFERGWVDRRRLEKAGIGTSVFDPLPDVHILQVAAKFAALSFMMDFGPEAGYLFRQFETTEKFPKNK